MGPQHGEPRLHEDKPLMDGQDGEAEPDSRSSISFRRLGFRGLAALAAGIAAMMVMLSVVGVVLRERHRQEVSLERRRPTEPALAGELLGLHDPFNPVSPIAPPAAPSLTLPANPFSTNAFDPYTAPQEDFQALDKNGDGFANLKGDHLPPMTLEQFEASVAEAQQAAVAAQGPEASAIFNKLNTLRMVAPNESTKPFKPLLRLGMVDPTEGVVDELYTFGAPGTGKSPLYDAKRPGGCFKGLRVYTRGTRFHSSSSIAFKIDDPVSSIVDFAYKHALMGSMPAADYNEVWHPITGCAEYQKDTSLLSKVPVWDNFWWIDGHLIYPSIMQTHADHLPHMPLVGEAPNNLPPLRRLRGLDAAAQEDARSIMKANVMAHFTFMAYRRTQQIAMDAPDWGWSLAARACGTVHMTANERAAIDPSAGEVGRQGKKILNTVLTFQDGCNDHLILYQHKETLECAVVWEGSDDFLDWLANLDFFPAKFCGFGNVHAGFRAKMQRMLASLDYRDVIWPKLQSCSKVTVAGHSLGGAQAELFAACANKGLKAGEDGEAEYKLVHFKKGPPQRLPEFFSDHAQGSFLKNRANGLCIDVRGTLMSDRHVMVSQYECETPESTFSKEQRWELNKDGFLVSRLSGKCVDGNPYRLLNGVVTQWPCEFGTEDSHQRWQLTSEGFLRNLRNGQCLSDKMTLYDCPFTDQRWDFRANGFVVNRLSGKCLDVFGPQGHTDGQALVLWPCELTASANSTDQRWELTPNGHLRNLLSGKCAVMKITAGREFRPAMVLGPCTAKASPQFTLAGGFLKSMKNGKCLNVDGKPGTADGAIVSVWGCQDKRVFTGGLWKFRPGGFLTNIGQDQEAQYKCMELFGAAQSERLEDGVRLWTDFCKVNTDQKWELTEEGHIKNVIGGRKCLDVNPAGKLWLNMCMSPLNPLMHLNLKWSFTALGHIKSHLGDKCLDLVNHEAASDGDQVQSWECGGPEHNEQFWDRKPDGAIVNRFNQKCLAVGTKRAGRFPLTLQTCAPGSPYQKWDALPGGFLVNRGANSCISAREGVDSNGKLFKGLVLTECPGKTTQQWTVLPNGQIQNQVTGKCIDTPHNQTGVPFWELVTWNCDPSRAEQQWLKLPTPKVTVTL